VRLSLAFISFGLAVVGCSSQSGTPLAPLATQSTNVSRSASSLAAYPISLQAFPISLSAYPSSLGALPVSLSALPICQPGSGSGPDTTVPCGDLKRVAQASIPAGTPAAALAGYHPMHLQGAYGVTSSALAGGTGQTVAIVSAFIDKYIEQDLGVYRSTFGLPPCTVASGCLTIDVPKGNRPLPDNAWGEETALDTEMVSAICPNCKIVVVEAKSAKISDLASAVDDAAGYHPIAISNSYATSEDSKTDGLQGHYNQANIAVVAGAGDTGYGPNFPAVAPNVIAVGGTSLLQNADGTFAPQTVWGGTGSGCSAYIPKPKWQTDTGCKNRTVNDIAAIADPQTGVAGYSTYGNGWAVYGGTSIASPIVAGLYALAGTTKGMHDASDLYAAPQGSLAWILGTNGACSPTALYLCTATGHAYNGPAGNGVPYGLAAFGDPDAKPTPPPPPSPPPKH
jgi:subtilase family serine protease